MHEQEVAQEVLARQEHANRRKNTQTAARSKNVVFLRFTRKNIRNARS